MDYFSKGQSDIFKLEIDENAKGNFLEMSRWTKFLAILGFVMLGIALVLGIFLALFISAFAELGGPSSQALASLGAAAPIFIIVMVLIIVGIYIYPTYALLKYSNCIKAALTTDNKEMFNRAIRYLKYMFKYMGILMIVVLAIYGLEILFAIIKVAGR